MWGSEDRRLSIQSSWNVGGRAALCLRTSQRSLFYIGTSSRRFAHQQYNEIE